jgi:hypothetical protein
MRRAADSPQLVCRALVQHDHATKRSTISTARLHTLAINDYDARSRIGGIKLQRDDAPVV